MNYVPVTVLPALIAPMVLVSDGQIAADPQRVLAAVAALGTGIATRRLLPGILAGMAAYIALGQAGF
ncbi:AzlD domain-containing protein [Thermohalobaculum sediminis]|uniref:AzlD domain-containing protein n=1 Tax=Thermohalobaculum sediminis TaxID=2939436 RepID=UPI00222874D0|nr:AzlD domain-containing protein [Limibaculum sediminis]